MESVEIEEDKEAIDENIESDGNIKSPFSTKDIKVTNATIALSSLIRKLDYAEIDLSPDFQIKKFSWDTQRMSRLIESILLRLPLPVFYFDVSNPNKWFIIDGVQRLSTLKKFIVDKELTLKNLEFLTELNGKKYDDLDRALKRVIDETQVITYQIEAQTPKEVRYAIFNRINTGGLTLTAQEIRQSLNQVGNGVKFLKEVSESEIFKNIVGVSSKRMLDRELVLRFIAFKLTHYSEFKFNNMSEFLDNAMEKLDLIKDENRLNELQNELLSTLEFSEKILGENHRFSRSIGIENKTKTLNRSLFDVITVCFSEIENKEKFLAKKNIFLDKFLELLKDEKGDFSKAITEGTSGRGAIEMRFKIIDKLIKEVLDEN